MKQLSFESLRVMNDHVLTVETDSDLSTCCKAYTTYMEIGTDEEGDTIWGLCCKACYCEI